MATMESRIRLNYLAIIVAAIVNFLFEAGWYSLFMDTWLGGIGHTREWLLATGVNPAFQYGTALVSAAFVATALASVVQLTGAQTWVRGIKAGALLWLGIVLPMWCTEYVFEVRPWSLLCVNAGFWFVGMMLMGAIVGAWKKK